MSYSVTSGGAQASPRAVSSAGNPPGCVRGSTYHATRSDCEQHLQGGDICTPRYINGAWDRFTPMVVDSAQCVGAPPPDLVPQSLDDVSLIQASAWLPLADLSLDLMMDGRVGSFTYSTSSEPKHTTHFSQSDLYQELDQPLMFVYSVPHGEGVMRLTLDLTSGRARVTWPMQSGFADVQYRMSTLGV